MMHILPGTPLAWPQPLRVAARWVWSRRWARMLVIATGIWHLIGAILLALAPTASAAETTSTSTLSNVFGWMGIKDSKGINAADYYLSINEGSPAHPGKLVWAWITNFEYTAYRGVTMVAIWLIKQALSFQWLTLVTSPITDIGDAVASLTGQLHMRALVLTLAGFMVALWMFRGRYATGLYELMTSLLIAAGVIGILIHPVAAIAGPDGAVTKAKDWSLEVATGINNDGNTSGTADAQVDALTSQLTDTFLRKPTQLLNFGQVLDSSKNDGAKDCVKAFDDAYRAKPGGRSLLGQARDEIVDNIPLVGGAADAVLPGGDDPKAKVREAVGKCPGGKTMEEYADNPGPEQAFAAMFLMPAAGLVFLLAIYLAGRVVLATVWAMWNSVKLIPIGVMGIAPLFRAPLLRALADVFMALLQICFAIIFTCAYCMVITSVFDRPGTQLMATVIVTDVLIAIGIWMFRRGMIGLTKWSDRLSEIMGRRPGASPVAVQPRRAPSAHDMLARARIAKNGYTTAKKVGSTAAKLTGHGATAAGAVATGGTSAALAAVTKTVAALGTAKRAAGMAAQMAAAETGSDTKATVDTPGTATPPPESSGGMSWIPQPETDTRTRSNAIQDAVTRARDVQNRPLAPTGAHVQPPTVSGRATAPAAPKPTDARPARDRVREIAAQSGQQGSPSRAFVTGTPTRARRSMRAPARPTTTLVRPVAPTGASASPRPSTPAASRTAAQRSAAQTGGPTPTRVH